MRSTRYVCLPQAGLLVDITKGWDYLDKHPDTFVKVIQGDMEVFPLCCSTGVVTNLRCQALREQDKAYFDKLENNMGSPTPEQVKPLKYLHELIRLTRQNPRYIWPVEAVQWYAMSMILQKIETGKDDSTVSGYNNYKAAQITFFDRLTEDKTNPKFNFANSYCTTYSCDHLMEWLQTQNGVFGEVYVSPPVPGAHGAKVRGCVFTPLLEPIKAYHDEHFDRVKAHILSTTKILKGIKQTEGTQW